MTEITSRLSTALADRYRIEGRLGEGGMATSSQLISNVFDLLQSVREMEGNNQ